MDGSNGVSTEHWLTLARHTPIGILCDLDGTLVPFARTPDEARPDPEAIALIETLATLPGVTMSIVSGRPRSWLEAFFTSPNVFLVAEHGATRRGAGAWLLVPIAVVAWMFVHESGVHATVAGVLLGFTVPVRRADSIEHAVRPISAGFAVPLFAFLSAGVTIGGFDGLRSALTDPVALGVLTGLVLGKPIGVAGSTWLLARFTRADLDDELSWIDVIGLSLLAGIGFTVSLLIGELAFGSGTPEDDHVKVAVLTGSLVSALLATVVLRARNRTYRRLHEVEERDDDGDGVPDVYQHRDERE